MIYKPSPCPNCKSTKHEVKYFEYFFKCHGGDPIAKSDVYLCADCKTYLMEVVHDTVDFEPSERAIWIFQRELKNKKENDGT